VLFYGLFAVICVYLQAHYISYVENLVFIQRLSGSGIYIFKKILL